MPHGCLALTPLASVLFHASVSPGLVQDEWEPSHRWWCDPIPCSQVTADAAGTFLLVDKEGLKRKRASVESHRSVASDLLVEEHVRVPYGW